jgi:hypothetical protein
MVYREEDTLLNPYIVLLSYPRSGSNFLYYILYSIMGVRYQKQHGASPGYWEELYNLEGEEVTLYKMPLVFILRNPKECIPRQTGEYKFGPKFMSALSNKYPNGRDPSQHHYDYIRLLEHYDKAEQFKIMVYYEDLLTHPEREIKRILAEIDGLKTRGSRYNYWEIKNGNHVLNPKMSDDIENRTESHNPDILEYFIKNYDDLSKTSINRYENITTSSESKGRDLLYHSKKIDKREIKKIDQYLKENYPYLVNKYLKRYLQ